MKWILSLLFFFMRGSETASQDLSTTEPGLPDSKVAFLKSMVPGWGHHYMVANVKIQF